MAPPERRIALTAPYDLAGSRKLLQFSRYDPCARLVDDTFWWAARTPDGPGTVALRGEQDRLVATGYGAGAGWLLAHADAIAGLRDDVSDFPAVAAAHPVVARLARNHHGLRLPATGLLFPRLLRAICEQKVTGTEAYRAYSAIVRHFGEPAPGPTPDAAAGAGERLLLPPAAATVAATPYWTFHTFGMEQRRAETLRRAAAAAPRLERCLDSTEATARMTAIVGIGSWSAAEVVRTVYGDPDAVSFGDFHIPNMVAWALAEEPRGDDTRMRQLLAPFAGHRGRVCILLAAAGIAAPRYGPRTSPRRFATF